MKKQIIIREEITKDEISQEIYEIETRGDLQYMPRQAEHILATFGSFERTGQGTLLYSATIEREANGSIGHNPQSEYLDDYRQLKTGNIEIIN